jgi:hypothetical protein
LSIEDFSIFSIKSEFGLKSFLMEEFGLFGSSFFSDDDYWNNILDNPALDVCQKSSESTASNCSNLKEGQNQENVVKEMTFDQEYWYSFPSFEGFSK